MGQGASATDGSPLLLGDGVEVVRVRHAVESDLASDISLHDDARQASGWDRLTETRNSDWARMESIT